MLTRCMYIPNMCVLDSVTALYTTSLNNRSLQGGKKNMPKSYYTLSETSILCVAMTLATFAPYMFVVCVQLSFISQISS